MARRGNLRRNAPNIPVSQKLRTLRRTDALGLELAKDRNPQLELESIQANRQQDSLVHAPYAECDELWLSWPQMQENAIAAGTVLIYDVITSVGNLFLAFTTMIQLARLLELGVILRWTDFPGFRQAFNPGDINWDLDPEPFMQQMGHRTGGANTTGLHSMKFNNFALVLSDSQLELLASTLNIREPNMEALAAHVQKELPMVLRPFMSMVMREPIVVNDNVPRTQPCTWNMFLRRSPSMMAGLEQYSPWGMANDGSGHQHHIADYIAWHIRTPDGESARSYSPTIHQYVLQEPSSNVCPTFMVATDDALELAKTCDSSLASDVADELVYISSNSKPMTKNCTLNAENHDLVMCHVDLGLDSSDAHTAHSQRPLETALGAFLDFLFLMDSAIVVRTGSSFSGTVVNIKGMNCHHRIYDSLPNRILNICLPPGC